MEKFLILGLMFLLNGCFDDDKFNKVYSTENVQVLSLNFDIEMDWDLTVTDLILNDTFLVKIETAYHSDDILDDNTPCKTMIKGDTINIRTRLFSENNMRIKELMMVQEELEAICLNAKDSIK